MLANESNYNQPENIYHTRGAAISKGNDFEVYEFGDTHVVKYPNRDRQENRPYDNKSKEFYLKLTSDHEKLKDILGDSLAETSFFPPSQTENANYRIIQQKFEQHEFLKILDTAELEAFILDHKEEFKDLINKAKKVEGVFGVPLDLTVRNLVFHEGKLLVVENDCPSVRFELKDKPEIAEKIERDKETISHWEKLVSK